MSSTDNNPDNSNNIAKVRHSGISTEQKKLLNRLVNNSQEEETSPDSTQNRWPTIANQLNQVSGGCRKTWEQWRQSWGDIKKNSKKSQPHLLGDSDKFTDPEWSMTDETVSDNFSCAVKVEDVQNGDDVGDGEECNARKRSSRLSQQQKEMLHSFMDSPSTQEPISSKILQKRWQKIASQLNQVPGARKTVVQWRYTWRDIKKNSKISQSQPLFQGSDKTDHGWFLSDAMNVDETCISSAVTDVHGGDESGDNEAFFAKRRQARNMSRIQKKLLHKLVSTNATLLKNDEPASQCLDKRKEWNKITKKLNSVTGPQKSWAQWKKCWHDIQKYYVDRDAGDQFSGVDSIDIDTSDTDTEANTLPTRGCMDSNEMAVCAPSATQLNCLVKTMAEHRNGATTNVWMSVRTTLNDIGPCVTDCRGWKNVWDDHKRKIQKLAIENGTRNLDIWQRLTYECIKREQTTNKGQQLHHLKRTAEQECNIVGSFVAVKLRSMAKEQKLIAEKLISEVLFQGQMEMFQYSDKAVNIPGYF